MKNVMAPSKKWLQNVKYRKHNEIIFNKTFWHSGCVVGLRQLPHEKTGNLIKRMSLAGVKPGSPKCSALGR
jgi:hypothetical protein